MAKIALFALFILFAMPAFAQNEQTSTPYTKEHAELVATLYKSFNVEIPAVIVSYEEEAPWRNWTVAENFQFGKDRGNQLMINDLNALHPYFRDKVISLITLCKSKGIELAVVETYRTRAKQNEYKAMGKKFTRTGAGQSKHQYGLAIDLVPMIDSVAQWDNSKLWKKIGILGESLGLQWGGRWKSLYDPGHFEWSGGLSSYHLSMGMMPRIPKQEKLYPCLDEDLTLLKQHWSALEIEQATVVRKEIASTRMN